MTSLDLASLGWDETLAASLAALSTSTTGGAPPPGPHSPARVTRVDRGACDVLSAAGARRATFAPAVLSATAHDPVNTPCVGDWVALRDDDASGRTTVEAVLPRRTAFVRAGVSPGSSTAQVLAANVDVAAVVEGLLPEPDLGRIERFLALAWDSGCQPVVVLTKSDLVDDADAISTEVAAGAPGADVVVVSSLTGDGVDALAAHLGPGRTLALLGPSGAGKSSLVNLLAGEEVMAIRALRIDGKGRHTTVHRELVRLPGGGLVIDTPGLRSVGLPRLDEGLDRVFADVEELAGECRFSDCRHDSEPGCAVLAAVESGDLPERRLASWRKLQREARWMAMRHDARLRAEEKARWKTIHSELKRSGRTRP